MIINQRELVRTKDSRTLMRSFLFWHCQKHGGIILIIFKYLSVFFNGFGFRYFQYFSIVLYFSDEQNKKHNDITLPKKNLVPREISFLGESGTQGTRKTDKI